MAASGWHRTGRRSNAKYKTAEHLAHRKRLAAEIAAGRGWCWRCGGHIPPGTPGRLWHVGHGDGAQADVVMGAEHRRCNMQAAARASNGRPSRSVRMPGATWQPPAW